MSLKITNEKGLLHLAASRLNKEKAFWEGWLGQDYQKSVMPADLFRQGEKVFKEITFSYPAALEQAIDQLTNKQDTRLRIFYAAVVCLLVHKFTNETKVAFAIPNHEHDPSVPDSPFLVLRIDLDAAWTLRQLLNQVKNAYLQVLDHRAYPLEIFEEPGNNATLFDIFLAVQDQPENITGHSIRGNLLFSLQSAGGALQYNANTYTESKAASMARYLQHMTALVLNHLDTPIGTLEIILPEEKQRLMQVFNATNVPFDRNKLLIDCFRETVQRFPARIAVSHNQGSITYQQLQHRSAQLAQLLSQGNVRKEVTVAVLFDRSIDFVVCLLAIIKTGAAFVGIDTDMPVNRMLTILQDAGAAWLITNNSFITDAAFIESLSATSITTVLSIDPLQDLETKTKTFPFHILDINAVDQQPVIDPDVRIEPDDLCYQVFSSGSTGKPKGILLHHLGMINHFNGLIRQLAITEQDVMAQTASCSFDIYVLQMLMPLVAGARIHIMERSVLLDPAALFTMVTEETVTLLELVPSHIQVLLNYVQDSPASHFSSLRYLVSNGEQLKTSLAQKWFASFPAIPVVNAYGPAEASDDVSIHIITKADESLPIVPIGRPLDNIQLYTVDRFHQLTPLGVEGELCVAGVAVGKGYLHDPVKTGKAFVNNPFIQDIQANRDDYVRMYKTGDTALWQEDGTLLYKGRTDFMVKIRGVRIELAEVEAVLMKYKTIANVCVTDYTHQDEKILCAYFEEASPTDLGDLDSFLRSELPDTMIPACLIKLDKIPCNDNGKVDRSKLPAPTPGASTSDLDLTQAPIKKLWDIWKEVLGSDGAGITLESNFFQLGGHSLTAIQLVAHINRKFSINLSIVQVFKLRTFGAIAGLIAAMQEAAPVVLKKADPKPYYHVSSAQRRFYIHHRLYPEDLSYNCPQFCIIKGHLDAGRVKQAFEQLMAAHEIFRTSFMVIDNLPRQVVHEQIAFDVLYSECRPEELDQHMAGFVYPFDLDKPGLLRVQLVKYREDEHLLFVDMHHIISDELSDQIVLQDFQKAYAGQTITAPAIQYKDYAEWEYAQLTTNKWVKLEQYWLQQFATLPAELQLPYDQEEINTGITTGNDVTIQLTREEYRAIHAILQQTATTPFAFFLTVFNLVLKNITGSHDIVVGTPVAGREDIALQRVVGLFLNQLALRNDLAKATTFPELLLQVKENTLAALAAQVYPFDVLTAKLGLQGRWKETPLYKVMFAHLRRSSQSMVMDGLELSPYPVAHHTAKAALQLTILENDQSFELVLTVDAGLFTEATASNLLQYCKQVLDSIIKDTDITLAAIPLPEAEGLVRKADLKRRALTF
ncbi:non-ribosomal peptide synthetase [Paraflavitalea soli]|nr:non-ribosomal peptide synthetase [Paraflavitalea soli]